MTIGASGLPARIPKPAVDPRYLARVNYELSVINKTSTETRPGQNWDNEKGPHDQALLAHYKVAFEELKADAMAA
jgi:hypothetical protein